MKMRKLLLSALACLSLSLSVMAQQNDRPENTRILVAYYSATGTTARTAEMLAEVTGGELYAISPVDHYTEADLDWHDRQSRSSVEMNTPSSRPAIKGHKDNMTDYDIIFLGYPIWWDLAPRVINTFIESHNLKGKTIIPFATSGGSSVTNSVEVLKNTYPDLKWESGRLLNRVGEKTIRAWVGSLLL